MTDHMARELTIRSVRHALWIALFGADALNLDDLADRLTTDLRDVDDLLAACDAAIAQCTGESSDDGH